MGILTEVSSLVQRLFGEMAEEVAKDHPVVQRRRKFTTATLAQTFILGFLSKPNSSDEELAQMAALFGATVSPQAVEQRHTPRLAEFLEALFRRATQEIVKSQKCLAPLLDRFTAVSTLDSSTITLPDALQDRFAGCGGSHGGGQAAMKLQVQWDLKSGSSVSIKRRPSGFHVCSSVRASLLPKDSAWNCSTGLANNQGHSSTSRS
jgi:hypothetical protein